MKKLILAAFIFAAAVFAQQNTLTQTSLSTAITATQQTFQVSSTTGFTVPGILYVDNEVMYLNSINLPASGWVSVTRGQMSTGAVAHNSGAMVLYGHNDWFFTGDPSGNCTASLTLVTPYINVRNGRQWLCSTVLTKWVPGWNNIERPIEVTASVPTNAGLVTPTGPLFHFTGSNVAITGFTVPVGFERGTICSVPDTAFTTTTANNIGLASTAVVGKLLCWTYDANAAKFYPTY